MTFLPDVRTAEAALAPRATRTRYGVVLFSAVLAVLTYVDRICISKAEPSISAEFKLTREQMGWVFAAFAWGYALFEVPGGWLGDRIGAKKVLARIVFWWSFFTAATGWAWNLGSLLTTRFLFGAGEAGCFPNVAKALRTWLPEEERVRAQSIVWLSARWGGAFTPLLLGLILKYISWRWAVALFASTGVLWAFLFLRWYRDNPRDHGGVNGAEAALIEGGARAAAPEAGPTPWKALLTSRSVGLLCLQYMCLNYAWFFYVSWLPRYLIEHLGMDGTRADLLNTIPLFLGGIGCLVCGFLSSRVARWAGGTAAARRLLACAGFGGAALMLVVSLQFRNPLWAMTAMGLASFANDFAMPVSWAACMDVGGRHVGTLSGMMNTMGAFAAGFAPIVTGAILERTGGNWAITFYVSAVLYILGLCCWMFLDPVTPLVRPAEPKPEGEPA
jgi:ACS family glucarate transporter-like MFS transporter